MEVRGKVIDLDSLSTKELLELHREVCRRASRIYGIRSRAEQETNYRAAMRVRDTRFKKGLSPRENVLRNLAPK